MVKIKKTQEFEEWLSGLTAKEQAQVEARLYRIEEFDHFGDCKLLEGTDFPVCELRWKNGWRVYFYRQSIAAIVVLLGGKKNDQKKDIKKAEVLLRRYTHPKK
ncbi:MAG TPA: type II toxin-antitoxin system RelE/ParE family toxin [Chlamydiales bacterium]|nr:type II toxin-antitoxin system RelE/ParE family toxin [Chlamydiales bacterium]